MSKWSFLKGVKFATIFAVTTLSSHLKADDYRDLTVDFVDLQQFMGDWYVQGHTPLVLDDGATNQIETYSFNDDGSIDTVFTFDRLGRQWRLNPQATVFDSVTNAHWKMQFLWPFTSDYLIVRLNESYTETVISVPNKELIWIMNREPYLSNDRYEALVQELAVDGYPVENLQRVTHNYGD